MKVLIVAKQNKLGLKYAGKLEKRLKNFVDDISIDPSSARRFRRRGVSIRKFDGDIIITVGGDGTLLWTAHQANVPILPVKIEGHGFLCTTTYQELIDNLGVLINHDYTVTERMRLQCSKVRKGTIEKYIDRLRRRDYPPSLNEIVFARKRPSKILEMDFRIDDNVFEVKGDGLMFTTPSGSTAYSASSGGSLIDPVLNVMGIIPLYPFFSKIKPMVIPDDKKIEVNVKSGDCCVIVDGHGGEYVKNDTQFIIEKSDPLKLINISKYNFYDKLQKEFLG